MRYFLLLFILLLACSSGRAVQPAESTVPVEHTVIYKIDSKNPKSYISLTYQNETGSTAQEDTFTPWVKTFTAKSRQFIYVSAQLNSDTAIDITCTITIDGQVLKEANSRGKFSIATCSGSVP